VPIGGRISFGEIARQTPLTEQMVGRIVRHAATMRIFCEPETGTVAHTKASALLANPEIRDWTRAGTEELGPAAGKVRVFAHLPQAIILIERFQFAEALEAWPGSQEPNETVWSKAHDSWITC
jgi:hypothetical protein